MTIDGRQCGECGKMTLDWSLSCPYCGSRALTPKTLAGRGRLYSWSTVRVAPVKLTALAPYTLVMVRLDDGPMVLGRWDGDGEIAMNQPVMAVRREHNTVWFGLRESPRPASM